MTCELPLGTTTSQRGAVRLAGVVVTVLDAQGRQVAALQSGDEGQFSLPPLPAGRYTVVAKLGGFRETRRSIVVQPGVNPEVNLDLEAGTSETVSVVVKEADSGFASSLASREVVAATIETRYAADGVMPIEPRWCSSIRSPPTCSRHAAARGMWSTTSTSRPGSRCG